jgi:hypothetical protein
MLNSLMELLTIPLILIGILISGHNISLNIVRIKVGFIEKLIIGFFTASSILAILYYFTKIDIFFIAVILAIFYVVINFKILRLIFSDFKELDLSFIIFYIITLYIYISPSYINIQNIVTSGGILMAHIDFFSHSSIIEQIKLQPEIDNTQILMYKEPIVFYHYGMYILPALISRILNISGIDAMLWFVYPIGVMILCSGIFCIVKVITKANNFVIIFLCLIILLISDTSRSLYFNNAIFDLPYLMTASPGVLFGTGIVLFFIKYFYQSNKINAKLFLFSSISLLEFRALYLPMFLFFSYFIKIITLKNKKILLLLIYCLIFCLVFLIISNDSLNNFYKFMLTFYDKSHELNIIYNNKLAIALQVLISALGGYIVLISCISFIYYFINKSNIDSTSKTRNIRLFLIYISVVISYFTVLIIPLPNLSGDFTEFIQRPFIVLNVVCSCILISYLFVNIRLRFFCIFICLPIFLLSIGNVRPYGFPVDHPWHVSSYRVNVDPSIVEVSKWIKHQAKNSVYVYIPVNKLSYSQYPEAIITAISGAPALLSRVGFYLDPIRGGVYQEAINLRLEFLKKVNECNKLVGDFKLLTGKNLFIISESQIQCLTPVLETKSHFVYHIFFK